MEQGKDYLSVSYFNLETIEFGYGLEEAFNDPSGQSSQRETEFVICQLLMS